jgi:phosphatidylglycerophosphate synthase
VWTHLPNLISLSRLALGLLFPLVPEAWQFTAVALGALSDYADGVLSRLLGVAGGFGKTLDPVADKVFVGGVLLTLLGQGLLTPIALLLLSLRDLIVIAGVAWVLLFGPRRLLGALDPSWLGKLTTVAQFVYLLLILGRLESAPSLLGATAVLGGLAGLDYLRRAWNIARRPGTDEPPPA